MRLEKNKTTHDSGTTTHTMPVRRPRLTGGTRRAPGQPVPFLTEIERYELYGIVPETPQQVTRPRMQRPPIPPASRAAKLASDRLMQQETEATNAEIRRVVQDGKPLRVTANEIAALNLSDEDLVYLRQPMLKRGTGTQLHFYYRAYDARKRLRDYRRDLAAERARAEQEREQAQRRAQDAQKLARAEEARKAMNQRQAVANLLALRGKRHK
jgi:hypothetical protein